MKNHLLNIHAVKWPVEIKEHYPAMEAKLKAFKPTGTLDIQRPKEAFAF